MEMQVYNETVHQAPWDGLSDKDKHWYDMEYVGTLVHYW